MVLTFVAQIMKCKFENANFSLVCEILIPSGKPVTLDSILYYISVNLNKSSANSNSFIINTRVNFITCCTGYKGD